MNSKRSKFGNLNGNPISEFHLQNHLIFFYRADLKNKHIEWDFFHPFITIVGKYDITGQVLLLPVRGKGSSNITLSQYRSVLNISIEPVKLNSSIKMKKISIEILFMFLDNEVPLIEIIIIISSAELYNNMHICLL